MALPNPLCLLSSLWRSLIYPGTLWRSGIRSSGHSFKLTETHHNCTVYIGRCHHCGKVDISWQKGDE